MTLRQKLEFIRTERFQDINKWEKDFISDLYEGLDGLPSWQTDEDMNDYLTERQIKKLNEIWENLAC